MMTRVSWILVVVGLSTPGMTAADCIDYGQYIRWIANNPAVGHGNYELDIVVSGTMAYVTHWSSLQIVDIATPASPVLLGSVTLGVSTPGNPALATGVTVVGSIAYVTDAYAGFYVVNVSNPTAPVVMGSVNTPGVAEDVAVSGTIAYVADHTSGLQVINVANPASPSIIATVDTPDRAMGVALSGTVAYVADQYSGVHVINISNPASPAIIGSVDTPGNAEDLRAVGTMVYVSDANGGVQVIDASNPASPVIVGAVDTPGYAWDLAISGTLAYVADGITGLQVIDISNPVSPMLIAGKDTPGIARAIAVSGVTAFVLDAIPFLYGPAYGLQVIDVSHVASVPVTGNVVLGPDSRSRGNDVVVSGSTAYLAATDSGLVVIDVSDPATPTKVASVKMPGFGQSGQTVFARDVAVSGTMAYVAYSRYIPPAPYPNAALAVIDVTNSASPHILGNVEIPNAYGYIHCAISGTRAFLGDGDKLYAIDVANPSQPVIVGTLSGLGHSITGVAASGSVVYVARSGGGVPPGLLSTVDVSNAASPVILGTATIPEVSPSHVTLSGQLAYVAVRGATSDKWYPTGFRVIDVSSPQAPTLLGGLDLVGRTEQVAVFGNVLYAASELGGVHTVDVSNPASPILIGGADLNRADPQRSLSGAAFALDTDGSNVYVTTYLSGFSVLPAQCAPITPVFLPSFVAYPRHQGILLEWATSSEMDFLGFHLHRSMQSDAVYERVTPALIAAGAEYRFLDTQVASGITYYYRLEAVDRTGERQFFGPVSARMDDANPQAALGQAFPNPVYEGPSTIPFTLASKGRVRIRILDLMGREVGVLLDDLVDSGEQSVLWDGRDKHGQTVPAGIYLYQIQTAAFEATSKLIRLQ